MSHALNGALRHFLTEYSSWAHLILIAFLYLLLFRPSVRLVKRYSSNWRARHLRFTLIDGLTLTTVGSLISGFLNRSVQYSFSAYLQVAGLHVGIWLAAILMFLGSTIWFSRHYNLAPIQGAPSGDLIDVPIVDAAQDTLGRQSFVDDLYAQIERFPFDDSFVFGINGPWGSGKTSVLNLLKRRLDGSPGFVLVEFNPWYFRSSETIIREFYRAVASSINQQFFYPHLRAIAKRYGRILAPTLKRYGIDLVEGDDTTVEELKQLVESYIIDTGRRIVVMIDDMDRALDAEVGTILQIVRLSASFRQTIFVLAYDQSQLAPQFKRLGMAPEFLEKIVQSPIDLPVPDKREVDAFLIYSESPERKSQLDKLIDRMNIQTERRARFDKELSELYPSLMSPFFSTLRNAKRFLASLSARLPAIQDEVNLTDFVLLDVLRVFANGIYQDIWNNQFFYLPEWSARSMLFSPFGFAFDEKEKKVRREKIRAHLERILANEPQKESIQRILVRLFPARIADAFERPTSYRDEAASEFRAEKRITHPDSFEKYFLLAVPRGTISDAAIEARLDSWTRSSDPVTDILNDLSKLSESHELVETLDRIAVFLNYISHGLVKPLLKSLSLNVASAPIGTDRPEQDAHFKLITFLMLERVPRAERQAAAEEMLANIGPIGVAIRLCNSFTDEQSIVTSELRRSLNVSKLREILISRFQQEVSLTQNDIFEETDLPHYVLYQIGTYGTKAAKLVNDYVFRLFKERPDYIGRLIAAFMIEYPGGHEHDTFNFANLRAVYDVNRLAAVTREAGTEAWSNEKEKHSIEAFLQNVDAQASSPAVE